MSGTWDRSWWSSLHYREGIFLKRLHYVLDVISETVLFLVWRGCVSDDAPTENAKSLLMVSKLYL